MKSAGTNWRATKSGMRSFPPKAETLQERYHLFLELNKAKGRYQIQKEILEMEQRLQESRQYIGQPKQHLEVEITEESGR